MPNKRQLICTVHWVIDKLLPVTPLTLKSVRGDLQPAHVSRGGWKPRSAALPDGAFAWNALPHELTAISLNSARDSELPEAGRQRSAREQAIITAASFFCRLT